MSRKDYYLRKALEVAALAERLADPSVRQSLRRAHDSWMMLARLDEQPGAPSRWPAPTPEADPTPDGQ